MFEGHCLSFFSRTLINLTKAQGAFKTKKKKSLQKKQTDIQIVCCVYSANAIDFCGFPSSGCSYTISLHFHPSSFNNYPFHCRNTRGHLRDSSAIDCSHLSSAEAVCRRDQYQPPIRTTYVCVCEKECVCGAMRTALAY